MRPTHPEYVPYPTYPPTGVYPRPPYRVPEPMPNRISPSPRPSEVYEPPPPNQIDIPIEVDKNVGFSLSGIGVSPEWLEESKGRVRQRNARIVAEIRRDLMGKGAAETVRKLEEILAQADAGSLTSQDLQALAAMMKPTLPRGMAGKANRLFHRLAVLSRLMALLRTAVPGGGPIPAGNQVPMALMPRMPRGTIIVLGNGAVLIGVGDLCRFLAVGRGNVAQACGMTVGIGVPLAESKAKAITGGALLGNADAKLAVNYNVNNHAYTMQPGYTQKLPAGRAWRVAFDRGGSFGEAKYTVSEGTYQFTLTDKGWDLFKHTFTITIDNGENPFEFFYTLDNQHQVVPPGVANKHTSIYPPLVRFDDGQGETKTKKLQSGVYRVAVNQENALDLFAADAVAPPSISSAPSILAAPSESQPTTTPAPPSATASASTSPAPFTSAAPGAGTDEALGGSLFGDQGDWRPSLFVSDVPEIAYFEQTDPEAGDLSVPSPLGKTG